MIPRKKKTCKECGKEDYIWSKGRCKPCASKSYKKLGPSKKAKDKTEAGPVGESVAEDEMHDIPEEVHPFPEDGLCITCGQGLDPDMAYCWSCGTKYENKDVGK